MKRTYLDHNATSPLRPQVVNSIKSLLGQPLANASSIHGSGRRIRLLVDQAREHVARFIGANPSEIVFTSGGTEANHLAWHAFQKPKVRVLTSVTEHVCILEAAQKAKNQGAELTWIPVQTTGELCIEPISSTIDSEIDFISLHHANNETGIIFPVGDISHKFKGTKTVFHTDAVQSVGKIQVKVDQMTEIDLLTLSSHKLGALAGSGALFVRRGKPIETLWRGGPQEKGRRTGTENILGIISLGAACEYLQSNWKMESQKLERFRNNLENELRQRIIDCEITGKTLPRLPNTTHVTFAEVDGESLVIALDLDGFDCSTGAACSSGSLKPSHVLSAMGMPLEKAHGSLRISLGWNTQEDDITKLTEILPRLVERIRLNNKAESKRRYA